MSIVVKNLTKIYGSQIAVNDISFQVEKGEVIGFLGPNGAGKSTTMKMITGIIQPNSGFIEVCGIKVKADDIQSKRKIGYLAEANPLYWDMYVREYLHFIGGVHQIQNKKSSIEYIIDQVGLTPESHKKIGQLSKGYKQRTGFAAALLHDPEVLILDEPTSGLDPNQISEIRELIKNLGKTKTILFSTHILQEVEALCQRAIIINKGTIVADDRLEKLRAGDYGKIRLSVTFKETIDIDSLAADMMLTNVTKDAEGNIIFTSSDPDSLRKKLMSYCVGKGLTIMSMQTIEAPLEFIFKSLTQNEQNNQD